MANYKLVKSKALVGKGKIAEADLRGLICATEANVMDLVMSKVSLNARKLGVVQVLNVLEDKSLGEPSLMVFSSPKTFGVKFPANRLFSQCEPNIHMALEKMQTSAYEFQPGCTTSQWIESTEQAWNLYKSTKKSSGFFEEDEWGGKGCAPFITRLEVLLTGDPLTTKVNLLGMPMLRQEFEDLPEDTRSVNFPNIWLGSTCGALATAVGAERHDGLIALPVILGKDPDFDTGDVKRSVLSFWSNPTQTPTVTAIKWGDMGEGEFDPTASVPAEWAWPGQEDKKGEEEGESADEESEDGEYINKKGCGAGAIYTRLHLGIGLSGH